MSRHNIEFRRVLRVCPQNQTLLDAGATADVIYDFEVFDNGLLTAHIKSSGGVGFYLADLDGQEIRAGRFNMRVLMVDEDAFLRKYLQQKKAGNIPSSLEIVERKERDRIAEACGLKAQEEALRLARVRAVAPDLLAALEEAKAALDHPLCADPIFSPCRHRVRAAIAKARMNADMADCD